MITSFPAIDTTIVHANGELAAHTMRAVTDVALCELIYEWSVPDVK